METLGTHTIHENTMGSDSPKGGLQRLLHCGHVTTSD